MYVYIYIGICIYTHEHISTYTYTYIYHLYNTLSVCGAVKPYNNFLMRLFRLSYVNKHALIVPIYTHYN